LGPVDADVVHLVAAVAQETTRVDDAAGKHACATATGMYAWMPLTSVPTPWV